MNVSEAQLLGWLAAFIWPFFRVGALFVAMPIFTMQAVPARARLLAALVITLVIVPVIPKIPEVTLFSYQGIVIAVQQIMIGLLTGFILQMVFSVMLLAGQSVAFSMGLGFSSLVDPATGVQVPVIGQVLVISGSLFFLGIDGHLLIFEMLVQSFITLPIAVMSLEMSDFWQVVIWSAQIFVGGVLVALPLIITILFINLSFGVASRAAPQLQIFGVGFPITIMMGMVLIWMTIPGMLEVFGEMLRQAFALVSDVLRL